MSVIWPPAPLAPFTAAVPAVTSYLVVHNLGYRPASITFFDLAGEVCEVGVVIVDANSLNILQDNPIAGTVSIT